MRRKPERHADFAIDPRLKLSPAMSARVALLPVDPRFRHAAETVVANALYRYPDYVFYSRDNNAYRPRTLLAQCGLTRTALTKAVDILAGAGLLNSLRTYRSARARWRSRFQATPRLRTLLGELAVTDYRRTPALVRLKDRDGLELSLTRSNKIRAIEADDLTRINDALTRHRITVEHPDIIRDSAGFLIVRGQRIDPTRVAYTRVFNGSLNGGGRLYGPYWQSLPRDVRTGLLIDGERTAEHDIPACHVQLLRAWAGLPAVPPGIDPYAVEGVPRNVVKKAVLVALNCKSRREAVLALNAELRAAGNAKMAASTIIKRMEAEMPDLPFFTQAALRLQNLDSDVCVRVHLACQAAGFVALSIHDGFVCQRSHRGALIEIVNREFGDACERLRKLAVSRNGKTLKC